MKVVIAEPPMMDEIDAHTGTRGKPVLYAWGDTIYNPLGVMIPPQLFAHEAIHEKQQALAGGPEAWWKRYLEDLPFRLAQEVPAHQAEYLAYARFPVNRRQKRIYLQGLIKRLSGPLYGKLVSRAKAKELILGEVALS